MPTFRFVNTETGEEFEDFISNSRKIELLENNQHIKQLPSGFSIISGLGSVESNTDSGWKDVLSKVAEAHPYSALAERRLSKSIKQVKTKEAINKHLWKHL